MLLGFTFDLNITLVVSWAFLTIVRFVDVNEREPVWALVAAFLFGAVASGFAHFALYGPEIAMQAWPQAVIVETLKFLALGATIAVFSAVARIKGWSEFTDLTDGIIYGIAIGLGFSACETMIREFDASHAIVRSLLQNGQQAVVYSVLGGLSQGVFTAVTGLGFGAAVDAGRRVQKVLYPLLGLAAAVVLNALFFELRHGDALAGTAGLVRAWLAVIIPMVILIGVGLVSLRAERAAIRRQLAPELDAGVLAADDLALLESFWRRQTGYISLLLRGRVSRCLALAGRHSRLVQLALLKRRAERQRGTPSGEAVRAQLAALREDLLRVRPIIVALVVFVLASAAASVATPRAVRAQTWPSTDSLLSYARRDIDGFWRRELGVLYRAPTFVGPYPPNAACKFERHNAVYCNGSQAIYYDPQFLDEQNHTIGDYAAVWILAHEWGHRVQHLQGKLGPAAGMFSIQLELQADCYAGRYTLDAQKRGVLSKGDDEEAVTSLRGAKDPLDFPWFEAGAHGTAGQRIDAFEEGFAGLECDGDVFWRRVHVDPKSAPATAPPTKGPVIGQTACRRGRFNRLVVLPDPSLVSGSITDAITATYMSSDGASVKVVIEAYRSIEAAQAAVSGPPPAGWTVSKEGPVKDGENVIGKWKLLTGKTEIMVFQKGQIVNLAVGASGLAWEFMTATPVFSCSP